MRARVSRAALVAALALAAPGLAPHAAHAQNLRIVQAGPERLLQVPLNRAVVVESDVPFAELSIANPEIADISTLSDRAVYVLGRSPGATTLTLLGVDGQLLANVTVRVEPDLQEFKERLGQILPGERIEVRTANDGIVLSGSVSSLQKLDRALELAERYAPGRVSNLMSVGGRQQVMLKVRFSEMSRSVSKGIQTGVIAQLDDDTGFSLGTGGGSLRGEGDRIGAPNSVGFDLDQSQFGAFGVGFGLGDARIGLLLEALEDKGVVRTLAEPNLTTLSGQAASFLAGGEYPVPILGDDNTVTVEFKPFGVELDFTPVVVDDDIISLELKAAVSSLDPSRGISNQGFSIDAFSRREASTTVQLRDGESFAVAGLLQDDFRDSVAQVPFLADIPVLGSLFRSSSYSREQSELVLIVTAHLVTPNRGGYALPTDNVVIPTEADLFLFGRTEGGVRLGGAAGEVARQDYSAPYGYVLK